RPVPRRVLPRPPCPHAGGLAAQKACTLPMLRLLNFRCSFCSNPLDETQLRKDIKNLARKTVEETLNALLDEVEYELLFIRSFPIY
ncbi:hypothetical protein ABG984_11220, partial [Collinsella aerofaciens]|uniref:hypothetical protein n=1 Tax=Collinsella aerofaciens TaxID=74426 RepID=UPI00325C196F